MIDEIEIWQEIPGFEGLYEASTFGQIRSVARINLQKRWLEQKILKQRIDKDGYKTISLCKDCKEFSHRVHRLVALTFLPNPNNYPIINHCNGIKDCNFIWNLQWCNASMNQLHSYRVLGNISAAKGKFGKDSTNPISVFQYSMEGFFVKKWECAADVMRELGIDGSSISKCLLGKYQYTGGFIWKSEYLGEKIEVIIKPPITYTGKSNVRSKAIYQLSEFNTIIEEFENASDVNRKLGYNRRGVCEACLSGKIYHGSHWEYKSTYDEYYNNPLNITE